MSFTNTKSALPRGLAYVTNVIYSMEDAELLVTINNLIFVKFDNNQLEIVYDPNYEPDALRAAAVSMMNTVTADEFGNIQFTDQQGGATLFSRNVLKKYFNDLSLTGVTNDI